MGFLILWLGFAAIVGVIGMKRGLGFWTWFLRSVLFSPLIAGIWVVAKKADLKQLEAEAVRDGSQKKCPSCAELVKAEAVKCRFCGELLSSDARSPSPSPPLPRPPPLAQVAESNDGGVPIADENPSSGGGPPSSGKGFIGRT